MRQTGAQTTQLTKRERNAAETRKRLLDAGEAEFAAKGFPGARLREIADIAHVQPALIAHHFGDKEGLYQAVLDRAFSAIAESSWAILEKFREPRELVSAFIDYLVDLHAQSGPLLAILRHEAASGGTPVGLTVLRERNRPLFEAIFEQLERFQREGKVRTSIDARELILATMGMTIYPFQEAPLLDAVWPRPEGSGETDLSCRKRTVVELVLRGILPEA